MEDTTKIREWNNYLFPPEVSQKPQQKVADWFLIWDNKIRVAQEEEIMNEKKDQERRSKNC